MILVDHLCKDFKRRQKAGWRWGWPRYHIKTISTVRGISFEVNKGERVAFIGPNGAGKSTTLKMLSGILKPTSGTAEVAGYVPWDSRQKLAYDIGLVFGQRSQLWYHLPVRESFLLLGKIYGLSKPDYRAQVEKLKTLFHLHTFLDHPVKALSLGQRMRCEIAASLLHRPKILFLDEPTIGLDVTAKAELRDHLVALGEEEGTTMILTSHDTDDIEKICGRVILINEGQKLIDMPLSEMRRHYLRQKQLTLVTAEETPHFVCPGTEVTETRPHTLKIAIDPAQTAVPAVIAAALQQLTVHDVTVSDVPLEEVIKHIYREGK